VFHVLRGPRPQNAGISLLLAVFTLKLDPGPGNKPTAAHTVQPPTKSPQTLTATKFLSNYTVHCNGSACNVPLDAPGCRVTEKAFFFSPIVSLAKPQTQATRMARSGATRLAIHYDLHECNYIFRSTQKLGLQTQF
jgi:hypothetical protein